MNQETIKLMAALAGVFTMAGLLLLFLVALSVSLYQEIGIIGPVLVGAAPVTGAIVALIVANTRE